MNCNHSKMNWECIDCMHKAAEMLEGTVGEDFPHTEEGFCVCNRCFLGLPPKPSWVKSILMATFSFIVSMILAMVIVFIGITIFNFLFGITGAWILFVLIFATGIYFSAKEFRE